MFFIGILKQFGIIIDKSKLSIAKHIKMKQIATIILLTLGFQPHAMQMDNPNNDCTSQIIKSSSNKNGIVKNSNGEIVTNRETMSIEINPCNHTVLVELNKKTYDLVLYKTDNRGTIHAATLDGKQIVEININRNTQEVETTVEDLIFTTYIDTKIIDSRSLAIEE